MIIREESYLKLFSLSKAKRAGLLIAL